MPDYSQLSDDQLKQLWQIQGQETNHAPDSSTVQSPKGASGNMQVMGPTQGQPGYGVKPSNGTPEDTAREGQDYYLALSNHFKDPTVAAIAYNWGPGRTEKWLSSGADLSKIPDETLKYAYNFDAKNPGTPTYGDGGLSTRANLRGQAAIKAMAPNVEAQGNALTGVGETMAQMATGAFGQAAGALHGGYDLATGKGYDEAHTDLEKERDAVTYDPKTEAGKHIAANVGNMFDEYLTKPLEQGGSTVLQAAGLSPEMAQHGAEIGTSLFENLGLPMAMHGMAPRGEVPPVADTAGAQLDALNAGGRPEMPPNAGPQMPSSATMTPNMGPQRPPITVDRAGNATNPLAPPDPGNVAGQMAQAAAERNAQFQSGDLFPQTLGDQGNASPFEPNRLAGEEAPAARGMLANQRQGELQLDNNEPIRVSPEGEAFPESMADQRDLLQKRTDDLQWTPTEQLDPMSGVDHPSETSEAPTRSLAPDEFQQAVQTLADRDPTKFSVPGDMDRAYQRYVDTLHDDAGDMVPKSESARRFAEAVSKEILDQRVQEHPTVKANQARVDNLKDKLAQAQAMQGPTTALTKQLAQATKTLEKAQDNIRKFFEPTTKAAAPFYAKDGSVHMYTFGYLPEMMKSIGALLKGIHGVVFKTLDKMIPNFKTLGGMKVAGQGIKDFVNRQATKDWVQTVNEQPKALLKGVDGLRDGLKDYLPDAEDVPPEQLKAQFQEAQDISGGKVRQFMKANFLTGQQMQAFTHHPLVKYAVNTVDRAMRNAQQFVRDELVGKGGLREKVRAMGDDELTGIWSLMELNEGARDFSNSELRSKGFSDKQIDFYRQRAELNNQKLQMLNDGRARAGLPPVERRVAHIAGHFLGDFKTLIKDADGNVKAVIAHNSKSAVKTIANRVLQDLGEGHTMTPVEMRKMSENGSTDRYTGYMNILNDLAGRDPVVDKVVSAYRDYMTNDAQAAMKYRAAFKSKEGVLGAEGRKSWLSATENAKAGVKNELKSLEAMNTWSEMQKALGKISDFQSDDSINAPNAKGLVSKYLDNVQHRNQGPISSGVNGFINGVSETMGIGPSSLRHMSAVGKEGLLTMFIGLGKLSHSFVTLIQPLQGIPVVNSLMKAEGAKLGLTQMTAALKSIGSQGRILESLAKGGEVNDPFLRKALQFAKENDTFNSSQFQFGNLTDINPSNKMRIAKNIAEFNVTGMETGTRAFTYMYYSHMLKDLGLPEKEIFPAAHNAMKDVMVDYNSWERPGVFGKLGFLGDLTAMLTRYKFNQVDQFARAAKFAGQGKIGPLLAVMTSSIAAAGIRGIMAYTLANSLVQATTTWAAKNNLMDKPTSIDEMLLHMLHGKNEDLSNAVKFGAPAALGINMTGSLSHADDIPNDLWGSLIPQSTPMLDMAKSAYQFARDPNKATAKTMAYDLAPNSAKGLVENKLFTDERGHYTNPHNQELQTIRSPADQEKRTFGFRPLKEANESLTTRVNQAQSADEGEVKQDIIQKVLRQYDSGNHPSLQPYVQKYIENNGNPQDIIRAIVQHQGMGQARTAEQRAQGIPSGNNLNSLFNYKRLESLK